ncbi:MAG TPA: ABC transporter permease [Rhizomicrobium sp.]|jgi:putative ABC transport system permease protein|nr:ABC transporter permease [Rhizomicrobium sp.]
MKQTVAVLAMNFKSLPSRFWPSLVVVVGMACVVGVLLSMMSFTVGIVTATTNSGDPGRAIVLSPSAGEEVSNLPHSDLSLIADAPGIARDADGKPLAEAEALVTVPMVNKVKHFDSEMGLRGVGPQSLKLRPKFRLVEGRLFQPGKRELIVGRAAQGQFANTRLGDKVILPDGEWPIVGVFTVGGDLNESHFLADRDTVMTANKIATYNSVLVRLTSPAAFAGFKAALLRNGTLQVSVERETDYYLRTTAQFSGFLNAIAYMIGGIMALGAIFGALNTMYAAVAARAREIATLRALGFGAAPVVLSVMSETLILCLAGALIGACVASALFDGNQKAVGSNVFNLTISPGLVLTGIIWAMVVGLAGGLLPSIHAARLSIVDGLRAS